jgi:hypothetical protein
VLTRHSVKLSGSSFGRAISESRYGQCGNTEACARWHRPFAVGEVSINKGKRLKMQIHSPN